MANADNDQRWADMEARLTDMEMRVAFQDDLMASLNDQIAAQEQAMQRLWDANRLLREQFKGLREAGVQEDGEEGPPPHY